MIPMPVAYINAPIFTGEDWLENHAVIVADEVIEAVMPRDKLPTDMTVEDAQGKRIVPGFLDLQIYGAGGKLFSAYPQPESLQALYEHNLQNGTVACLVTIATQPMDVILQCIDAIKDYWKKGGKGILGMHLEGPFINPEKRGAHVEEWIHTPWIAEIRELLQRAKGVIKMITVAPETCSPEIVQMIQEAGVVISAGHSNATVEIAKAGFGKGITTVTHLFNAMSSIHHRKPGLPVAAMNYAPAASIIPDGIHVDYEMVRLAKLAMGERLFFITDAVTECKVGPYRHILKEYRYVLPNGTLSGSALTLQQAVVNAVQHCGISLDEAIRMASLYPARVIGATDKYGKVAPGYAAPALLPAELLSNEKATA